ncbi:putative transferase CAF17 homolog, mitochondrial [Penaeus indicus]|uniref:putative transferase CAF17 homolog, mitochondrial n=1 Tax=Penaeus indicus TaxID=29960 RepID=UPI00300D2CBC
MLHVFSRLCPQTAHVGRNWARISYSMQRNLSAEVQSNRSLAQVNGKEASAFLQGLVTNDMNHLLEGATSMYSMMLNTQGRVVFDTIIYKRHEESYLVECDREKLDHLVRHLKMYKVRRKIDIKPLEDFNVWAVFEPELDMDSITQVDVESLYLNPKAESEVLIHLKDSVSDVIVTRDPRMKYLGHRLVVPDKNHITDIVSDVEHGKEIFKFLRYKLGVGEGLQELPPTKCLPLEANLDYLHGVSFHKGCYIGQELTARTFHTGVVRKRYMPLIFPGDTSTLAYDTNIINEKGKSVGKVRGIDGQYGIGLLRVKECLAAETLTANDMVVKTFRPPWWPIEASKEKMN